MTATSPAQSALLRDGDFRLLWTAQTASIAGAQVRTVVLPVLMYQLSGSASLTAWLLTVQALPYLVFGLLAGAVSDRSNRRVVMVVCDLASALSMASIPLAAALGELTPAQLFVAAALTGTAFVWHDSALFGALPAIVGRDRVVGAYSILISTSQVLQIAATALAGILIATVGAQRALWIDAACYALSAVAILALPGSLRAAAAGGPRASLAADVREGLRYVRRHPLVWPLTVAGFGSALSGGAVTGLVVVYGVQQLKLAADGPVVGWLFTALAGGGLLAGAALPVLTRRTSQARLSIAGLAAMSVLLVSLALNPWPAGGLAMLFLWGTASTLVIANGIALRQQVTPDRLQGRVNVTARMIAYGGTPIGAAIGGALADRAGIRITFLVMTLGVALSSVYAWRSPLRRVTAADIARLSDQQGRPPGTG